MCERSVPDRASIVNRRPVSRLAVLLRQLAAVLMTTVLAAAPAAAELRVGAVAVDVSPQQFPVLINGGMTSRSADQVKAKIHARALVLDDGRQSLALVVVDSCMMPRDLLDEAKTLASKRTGIRPDRMMISATHTHTAPASMGCLGTDVDPAYRQYLRVKLADAIEQAQANLQPAKVGWGVQQAADFTAVRRWIRRPDRLETDPFGNPTVRANMHAARNPDDVTGPSGPEDPDLSLIAFQSLDGHPIAVLGNFSMHYFSGVQPVHPDYFGLFCERLQQRVTPDDADKEHPPVVGIMSHGCSGDIWRRDYSGQTPEKFDAIEIDQYTDELLEIALEAYQQIQYTGDADLQMAETRLPMQYRVPDKQRLQWAQQVVAAMGDAAPKSTDQVYAREQVLLDQWQSTEVVVQAIRIGTIGIATTPTETYALTGLKIKRHSPLQHTMVIELANGGDGYIPPPEQHLLGGYNTWAARSAGLEVQAEPRIAEAAIGLLEGVSGEPRREASQSSGPAAQAVLDAAPSGYWRMDEMAAPRARDASGKHRDGIYEPGVVFFLEGPQSQRFCEAGEVNRAAHFAGGRLRVQMDELADRYTASMWIWNGMPDGARPIAGWLFSRGANHGLAAAGEQLGLGGAGEATGRLVLQVGDQQPAIGRTPLPRWTWAHVALVRDGQRLRVYLNGNREAELDAADVSPPVVAAREIFFGGRSDNQANWEGRLDEIALFDRPLSDEEIRTLAATDNR